MGSLLARLGGVRFLSVAIFICRLTQDVVKKY